MRYLDTSSLVALYFPEEKTDALTAHLRLHPLPLAFTWLHEMEFTNGLQLKLFRKEATPTAVAATLDTLRADVESGVLHRSQPSWPTVFATALRLSNKHSRTLGTGTLDGSWPPVSRAAWTRPTPTTVSQPLTLVSSKG